MVTVIVEGHKFISVIVTITCIPSLNKVFIIIIIIIITRRAKH